MNKNNTKKAIEKVTKKSSNAAFDKYKFRKYDSRYKKQFLSEKAKLKRIFPSAPIEHIGSTAVQGLGGKGIIDIMLGIKRKEAKAAVKILKNSKYLFIERAGDVKERWFFRKDYIYGEKIRRVHVHLTLINSRSWNKCLIFRDYLRKNKAALKEYSDLKKKAVKLGKKDDEYRDYKKKFIESIEKKNNSSK